MSNWTLEECSCCLEKNAWVIEGSADPQGIKLAHVRCRTCRGKCKNGVCRVNSPPVEEVEISLKPKLGVRQDMVLGILEHVFGKPQLVPQGTFTALADTLGLNPEYVGATARLAGWTTSLSPREKVLLRKRFKKAWDDATR